MYPRRNDRQLLPHAVGIGGNGPGKISGEFKDVGIFTDTGLSVCCADAKNIRNEVQIFDAGHVVVQIGVIRYVSNLTLAGQRIGFDGLPVYPDFTLVKLQNAHHRFQRCDFACSISILYKTAWLKNRRIFRGNVFIL